MAHILPQLGAINAHEFDSPMSQTKFNGQKPVGKPDQFFQIFDFSDSVGSEFDHGQFCEGFQIFDF